MSDQIMRDYEAAIIEAGRAGDLNAVSELNRAMMGALKAQNPSVDAPMDPAVEGARMAAKDTGTAESIAIGAGRKVSRIGGGLMDLARGNQPDEATRNARKAEDIAYSALQREHPVGTAAGEALPYVAVPTSAGILGGSAIVGGLEAAQPGTAGERASRGAFGFGTTMAGGLTAKGLSKVLSPVTTKAAGPANQTALAAAERVGVNPRLSQVTGSDFLKRLEDTVSQLPGGGGVMAEHQAGNATALTRAAARAIGETSDELTPEVFANAADRLGKVFDAVKAGGNSVAIGPNVGAIGQQILATQAKMIPAQQDQSLISLAKQAIALAANRGRIDGETYQLMRSGLSDAAFDATVGTNKQLYGKLLNALDDSAEASLRAAGNDALADALKVARPQWANLKILEKGLTVEGGNVIPSRVASTMRTNNPGAFRRGNFLGTDIGDVATIGENLKPLREGSQTFARSEMNPLTAGFSAAWSYPTAKILTSPAVSYIPRVLGRNPTAGAVARNIAQLSEPTGRAAVAATLQRLGIPLSPVAAEQ